MVTQSPHAIFSQALQNAECANIIVTWTWQINLHVQFYFARALSQKKNLSDSKDDSLIESLPHAWNW